MTLTQGQRVVLTAMQDFGQPLDDVALAIYVHHVADEPMSSSGVRSRRAELSRKGLVEVVSTKTAKSGRQVAIHAISAKGQKLLKPRARKAVA